MRLEGLYYRLIETKENQHQSVNNFQYIKFRIKNLLSPSFRCPICRYRGPFQTARPGHALRRRHALCPKCGSSERQRVQWLIMQELSSAYTFREKSLLHFAPESIFRSEFRKLFAQVTTTDLAMPDVDVKADIVCFCMHHLVVSVACSGACKRRQENM